MEWKRYPLVKPHETGYCYVTNVKRGTHSWLCFYDKRFDYFSISDPRYEGLPLEITHFIELPFVPNDKQ